MNCAAARIARIATGEEEESPRLDESKARAGRKGGQKRAEKLSSKERTAIAKKGAAAREAQRT